MQEKLFALRINHKFSSIFMGFYFRNRLKISMSWEFIFTCVYNL